MSEQLDGYCLACGAVEVGGQCADPECSTHLYDTLKAEASRLQSFERGWNEIEAALGRTEEERASVDLVNYVLRLKAELVRLRERGGHSETLERHPRPLPQPHPQRTPRGGE